MLQTIYNKKFNNLSNKDIFKIILKFKPALLITFIASFNSI